MKVVRLLDNVIRFFLYVLIFWLPYAPAVVETCVIAGLFFWLIKRGVLAVAQNKKIQGAKEKCLVWAKAFRPVQSVLNKPIVLFLVACLISSLMSAQPLRSLHAFLTKTVEWFVVYFLFLECINTKKYIRICFWIFGITAVSVCVDALLQYYVFHKDIFRGFELILGRATASFQHPNSLGAFLTIVIPVIFSLVSFSFAEKKQRFFWIWFGIVSVWALVLTFSRGAWLAVILGIGYLGYHVNKKWFLRMCIVIVILGMIVCVLPLTVKESIRMDTASIQGMVGWRADLWVDSFKMVKEKPLFGHGINTFMTLFQDYRRLKDNQFHYAPTYAHNCYVQLTTETGFFGLIMFLWILKRLFATLMKKLNSFKNEDVWLRTVLRGLLAGAVAFLFHSGVDTNLYSLQLSVFFWMIVGLMMAIVHVTDGGQSSSQGIEASLPAGR